MPVHDWTCVRCRHFSRLSSRLDRGDQAGAERRHLAGGLLCAGGTVRWRAWSGRAQAGIQDQRGRPRRFRFRWAGRRHCYAPFAAGGAGHGGDRHGLLPPQAGLGGPAARERRPRGGRGRGRLTRQQGLPRRDPIIRGKNGRVARTPNPLVGVGPAPAYAARSAGHPRRDLGGRSAARSTPPPPASP